MSKAKTTKIAKKRSALGLYRQVDELLRHGSKRSRPHDGLIDGSGVQSGTDANHNPERETE